MSIYFRWICFAVVVSFSTFGICADPADKPKPGTLAAAEAFLKTTNTVSIGKEIMPWTDGGSKTVPLSAPGSDDLYVTFDGRMPEPGKPNETEGRIYIANMVFINTGGRIHLAGSASFVFGEIVPSNSKLEDKIVSTIQKALDSELSTEEQKILRSIKKYDPSISKRKYDLLHVLHALDSFQSSKKHRRMDANHAVGPTRAPEGARGSP